MAAPEYRQRGLYSEFLGGDDIAKDLPYFTMGPKASCIQTPKSPRTKRGHYAPQFSRARIRTVVPAAREGDNDKKERAPKDTVAVNDAAQFCAFLEPKVQQTYVKQPGRPPRKVLVERKKRLFASKDIDAIFALMDIDVEKELASSWLPLSPFDDHSYETRTPAEWIRLGIDAHGNYLPLPAKGYLTGELREKWKDCLVYGYDEENEVYRVRQWVPSLGVPENAEEVLLPRLLVMFEGENPEIFCERMEKALRSRKMAEALIKYNFYVDNMPTQEMPQLEDYQQRRLQERVVGSWESAQNTLKDCRQGPTRDILKDIMQEVNLDYARTMNKIVFDEYQYGQKRNESEMDDMVQFGFDRKLEEQVIRQRHTTPPWYALKPLPEYDFAGSFSSFCFATLLIQNEVVTALHQIKAECNTLMDSKPGIFVTEVNRTIRLEELRQMERSAIATMQDTLRDNWTQTTRNIILSEFKDVKRGWFNLHDTDAEAYEYGKLKKFMTLIRLIMQDTLRCLAHTCINDYCDFLERRIPTSTAVDSIYDVVSTWPGGKSNVTPLFHIEMCRIDAGEGNWKELTYTTPFTHYVEGILDIFDKGLASVCDIPQIARFVLPHLFKTGYKLVLACASHKEPWVVARRAQLEQRLRGALTCLEDYLAQFANVYGTTSGLNIDVQDYVAALDVGNRSGKSLSVEGVQGELDAQQRTVDELTCQIAEHVPCGAFLINCTEIRRLMIQKHKDIVDLELSHVQQRLSAEMTDIVNEFKEIHAKIKRMPHNIEDLVVRREFMHTVPRQVLALKATINRSLDLFSLLESYEFRQTEEDNFQRWRVFGLPQATLDLLVETEEQLKDTEASFQHALVFQQKDFHESLRDLQDIIDGFLEPKELKDARAIADTVDMVNERFHSCSEQARLFQQRERLFKLKVTDYSVVAEMARMFEPFSHLWITAAKWLEHKDAWYDGPVSDIDTTLVEDIMLVGLKQLAAACSTFKEEQVLNVLTIATKVLEELNEFKPLVPLILSLCQGSLRDRHWDEISTMVKTRITPAMDDFTISHLVTLGLMDHVSFIKEVAERADKERELERSLQDMAAKWQHVLFTTIPHRDTGTMILEGSEAVIALLDEHIVETQRMMFSPYKQPFDEEIEQWAKKLFSVSETLEEWMKVQKSWVYLQPIFDAPDIVKKLPGESKRYKVVDITWRSIMRSTHDNPHALTACSRDGLFEKWVEANRSLELVLKGLCDFLETKRSGFARFYFLSNHELLEILSDTTGPAHVQPFLRKVFPSIARAHFSDELQVVAMESDDAEVIPFTDNVTTGDKNVEVWMGEVERGMLHGMKSCLLTIVRGDARVEDVPTIVLLASNALTWTDEVETAIVEYTLYAHSLCTRDKLKEATRAVRCANIADNPKPKPNPNPNPPLTDTQFRALQCMCLSRIHQRDVEDFLVKAGVVDVWCFEWTSQLRHYWNDAGDVVVKSLYAVFPFGYEYVAVCDPLYRTYETERCYLNMMIAHQLDIGLCAQGAAGGGKTETLKSLAHMVLRQMFVFNMDANILLPTLAKFFKGLVSVGSWACFNNIDCLDPVVLSVAAQFFHLFLTAKQTIHHKSSKVSQKDTYVHMEIDFEGCMLIMKPTFHVFVTANPSAPLRHALPPNLLAQFRVCAFVHPSVRALAEVWLRIWGFSDCEQHAQRLHATCDVSRDLFTYAGCTSTNVIRGVVQRAAKRTRDARALVDALMSTITPTLPTAMLAKLKGTLYDIWGISAAPSIPQLEESMPLDTLITATCEEWSLEPTPYFVTKTIQLYQILDARYGCALVGPSLGGKTTCYRTLRAALHAREGISASVLNPNSLTRSEHFLGALDAVHEWADGIILHKIRQASQDRQTWIILDARLSTQCVDALVPCLDITRTLCLPSAERVLLPSKLRFLFETETLDMSPAMISRVGVLHMCSEELGYAPLFRAWLASTRLKPALVALIDRVGLYLLTRIHTDPALRTHALCAQNATASFVTLFARALESVRTPADTYTEVTPVSMRDTARAMNFRRLETRRTSGCLDGRDDSAMDINATLAGSAKRVSIPLSASSMAHAADFDAAHAPQEAGLGKLESKIASLLLSAAMWAFGGSLDKQGRHLISAHIWRCIEQCGLEPSWIQDPIPKRSNWFDYRYDARVEKWMSWADAVPPLRVRRDISIHDVFVPTLQAHTIMQMLSEYLYVGAHVLLCGPRGSGKSSTMAHFVYSTKKQQEQTHTHPAVHHGSPGSPKASGAAAVMSSASSTLTFFSFQLTATTGADYFIDAVASQLDKRARGVYGPLPGKRCVIFIDDIHLPYTCAAVATTSTCGELLRMWLDHGGWHDRRTLQFCEFVDISLALTLTTGRNMPPARLLTKVHALAMDMERTSVECIFTTVMQCALGVMPRRATLRSDTVDVTHSARCGDESMKGVAEELARVSIDVLEGASKCVSATPLTPHYAFTIGDSLKALCALSLVRGDNNNEPDAKTFKLACAHEHLRVFTDRMCAASAAPLITLIEECFSAMAPTLNPDTTLFGTLITSSYEEMNEEDVALFLRDFAQTCHTHPRMPVIVFKDFVHHACRLSRVLHAPKGHACLLGMGASGRRSVAKLVAYAMTLTLIANNEALDATSASKGHAAQAATSTSSAPAGSAPVCIGGGAAAGGAPAVSGGSPDASLKQALLLAGQDNKNNVVYYFSPTRTGESADPHVFHALSAIFSPHAPDKCSTDLRDVFTGEEMEAIVAHWTPIAQERNISATKHNVFAIFTERVKANLHVVFCLSHLDTSAATGTDLSAAYILRAYPNVLRHCTFDVYGPWSTDALQDVASGIVAHWTERLKAGVSTAETAAAAEGVDMGETKIKFSSKDAASIRSVISPSLPSATGTQEAKEECMARGLQQSPEHAMAQLSAQKDRVAMYMAQLHSSAREVGVRAFERHHFSPGHYLDHASLFFDLYMRKFAEHETLKYRLSCGIRKLHDIMAKASELDQVVSTLEPSLQQMHVDNGELADAVAAADKARQTQLDICQSEEATLETHNAQCMELAEGIERILSECAPSWDAAVTSLHKLKMEHVREVKALAKPSVGVLLTIEALCMVFHINPKKILAKGDRTSAFASPLDPTLDFWESAKVELLKDPKKLVDDLLTIDRTCGGDADLLQKLRVYVEREECDPVVMRKTSIAGEAFCLFVRAMYKFHEVHVNVLEAQERHADATSVMTTWKDKVAASTEVLDTLRGKYEKAYTEYQQSVTREATVKADMEQAQVKTERARKLLESLPTPDEWQSKLDAASTNDVLHASLLASALVVYSGVFSHPHRVQLEDKAKALFNLELEKESILVKHCGDLAKLNHWRHCGLADDRHFMENGIILDTARRWPFLIDPQQQALRYIKDCGKHVPEGVEVIRLHASNFMRTLELGVQFGKWIVLENAPAQFSVHPNFPYLEPLLHALPRDHTPLHGTAKPPTTTNTLRLSSDKILSRNESFRFFITTHAHTVPTLPSSINALLSIIDFTLTNSVLELQLLSHICARELPELEERYTQLTTTATKAQREIITVENDMLSLLDAKDRAMIVRYTIGSMVHAHGGRRASAGAAATALEAMPSASGDILDDEQCVNAVLGAKMQLVHVGNKVADTAEALKDVEGNRGKFLPVAAQGVQVYQALTMLKEVDRAYEFGYVAKFFKLLSEAIDEAQPSPVLSSRLQHLQTKLCAKLYEYASKGMWRKHRPLLGLVMAMFLENAAPEDIAYLRCAPEHASDPLAALNFVPGFEGVDCDWHLTPLKNATMSEVGPPLGEFPGHWGQMNYFKRLLIVYAMRPDFLFDEIDYYVHECVLGGAAALSGAQSSTAWFIKESSPLSPLIFIVGPGYSAHSLLSKEAHTAGAHKRFETLSLGEGCDLKAQRMIEEGQSRGNWVLLENCHLHPLDFLAEQFAPACFQEEFHRNFRLFLSTTTGNLPMTILLVGVKVVLEHPESIQDTLLNAFKNMPAAEFDEAEGERVSDYRELLFSFSLFHAVLHERLRLAGFPLCVFRDENMATCRHFIRLVLRDASEGDIPFEELRYITSLVYGAEVPVQEMSTLQALIDQFIVKRENVEDHGVFQFPEDATCVEDVLMHIENMQRPEPQDIGLHPNWEIAADMNIMRVIQRDFARPSSESIDVLAHMTKIQAGLPKPIKMTHLGGEEDYLRLFFTREIDRYNAFVELITDSVNDIVDRLGKNTILRKSMTVEDSEEIADAITNNRVPTQWSRHGYVSTRPFASWMVNLCARLDFLRTVRLNEYTMYRVNCFWDPRGFFTALKMNFATKNEILMDSIVCDFVFITAYEQDHLESLNGTLTAEPPEGEHAVSTDAMDTTVEKSDTPTVEAVIAGLTIYGCSFTAKMTSFPIGKQLTDKLRACTVKMRARKDDEQPPSSRVTWPVYKVAPECAGAESDNFVFNIPLPCDDPSVWKTSRVFLTLEGDA